MSQFHLVVKIQINQVKTKNRTSLIECNISHSLGAYHHEVHSFRQKEYCETHDVDRNS